MNLVLSMLLPQEFGLVLQQTLMTLILFLKSGSVFDEIFIAIPTHDRGDNGPKWMRELLESIKSQTYQILRLLNDQSKNNNILDVCMEYPMTLNLDTLDMKEMFHVKTLTLLLMNVKVILLR